LAECLRSSASPAAPATLTAQLDRAVELYEALAASPTSRYREVALFRVGDARWSQGHLDDAAAAYRRALAQPSRSLPTGAELSDDVTTSRALARAWFRIATHLAHGGAVPTAPPSSAAPPTEGNGANQEAAAAFKRVAIQWPTSTEADAALDRLARWETPTERALSAPESLARARKLIEERAWERAAAELRFKLPDFPPELRPVGTYWLGKALYQMRSEYAEAAKLLLSVAKLSPAPHGLTAAQRLDALFHGARALSRADRDDDAIREYREVVARAPESKWAAEARYLIGWLDYNRGRYREALEPLATAARALHGRGELARQALWFRAWSLILLGQDEPALEALAAFEKAVVSEGALELGKAWYWRGRVLDRLGRKPDSTDVWERLVRRWPLTWYGMLASGRLAPNGGPPSKSSEPDVGADAPPTPTSPLVRTAALQSVDELLAAKIPTVATDQLLRSERALLQRYRQQRGANALAVLLDRYTKAHAYHRLNYLSTLYSGSIEGSWPTAANRRVWELAYPRAFATSVERHAPVSGVPPLFLYALMRKESGFKADEVSVADAQGLLQMTPSTAERVGAALQVPYVDRMLYEPDVNIHFGAWYVGRLVEKFRGQLSLVAGAYNAGAPAMMRWCKSYGGRPLDEFVELIPYQQSREYIKKVMENYVRYRALWSTEGAGDTPPPFERTVNASYRDDDLTF
jgi:soluble lytic murein transglycosylase